MYDSIRSMSFLFPILVYTVLCCNPKDAISLEQENRFRNVASSWDMMQAASSDVLNFACKPDDLECKKMQLHMPADTNEQDRQRKRCDACLKSYRCAKLRKCEPCEKICRNDFFRDMENVGSVNKIDEYSAYFTLGEFGPGFQMDQIVDLIGLPEKDKYEKVVIIGKTKDQNGLKKCKALLIDPVESFKDIKDAKCAGMVLKKTETEEKLVAPSNIQEYIESAENHLITEMVTERTITVTKDIPVVEKILNPDFTVNTQNELENSNNDQIKLTENLKAARSQIEATKLNEKLREENKSFQSKPGKVTEEIEDSNEFTKWSEKKLIRPALKKGILKFKSNSDTSSVQSNTETNSAQNTDNLELLRQQVKDSNDLPMADEKVDIGENFKSQFNSLSSFELSPSENLASPEYYLNQNLSSPNNLSTTHQSRLPHRMPTRLLPRKHNRPRPTYRHRVSSIFNESNSNVALMSPNENTNPLQSEDTSLEINKRLEDKEPLDLLEKTVSKKVPSDQQEPLESNLDLRIENSSSNKVPALLRNAEKKSNNEETLESTLVIPQEKVLAPLKRKETLKTKYSEQNKAFNAITELPIATDKELEIHQVVTDSNTDDFLQEEYRDLEQLQRLYFTTPKIDTVKRKWKGEHPSTLTEPNKSTSFDEDTNVTVESDNKSKRKEMQNRDELKSSKENKTTGRVLTVPKAHKNMNEEQGDVVGHPFGTQKTISAKSANLVTKGSFSHSKEVGLQQENIESEFNQLTEKVNDSSDSFENESESDSDQFVEPTMTIAFTEPTKEETSSNEGDQNSNANKEFNIILTPSESRKTNTILPLLKQKHAPIVKSKVYSSLKQEPLIEPDSNITYLELEEEKTKLISSNQVKDKLEKTSKVSDNIEADVNHEQNLDSLIDVSRSDNYSTEIPKEEVLLKSTKQKLKNANRRLKTPKNIVSTELSNEPSLITNFSKPENAITTINSEEKLQVSTHANKKLKDKHAFPTNMEPTVARTKETSGFTKTGETVTPTRQSFTNSFDDESDIVSGIPVNSESSSLDSVLKAKHLDSLVQEIEQLPPLIYDRALKVSSALSKLQSTSSPTKSLIQLLSTKKLQGAESKKHFVKTNVANSNPVAYQINSDEKYENLDESFTTTEEASLLLKGIDFKDDKIISSEGNIKSKEMKIANNFNEHTPTKVTEPLYNKPLKVSKKESFLKKKSDKKLKENLDDSTLQSSEKIKEKAKEIVSKSLQNTGNNDQVGSSNTEILSKENIFKNFGRVIPNIQDYPLKTNGLADNLLFLGNDIHLPLNAKKNDDGSYKLSLDIEKLCDCKELGCNNKHAPKIEEEKRNVRGASHTNFDTVSQDKVSTFSDFLGQLRKISKTSSHPDLSKAQYNNEILKLISSIRPSHVI